MIRAVITGFAACALMTGVAFAQDAGPNNASRAGSLKEQPAEIPGFRPSGTIVDVRHGHCLHDDPVHSPVIVRRALTSPGERSLFYGTAVERAA